MMKWFKFAVAFFAVSQIIGCAEETPEAVCIHTYYCANGGEIQSCSDGSSGWYTLRGSSYYCVATYDCSSAASTVLSYCTNPYKPTAAKSAEENFLLSTMENAQLRKSIDQMYIDLGNDVQTSQ